MTVNHVDYFAFIDSFNNQDCPLCAYILRKKGGCFQNVFSEGITISTIEAPFSDFSDPCTDMKTTFTRISRNMIWPDA